MKLSKLLIIVMLLAGPAQAATLQELQQLAQQNRQLLEQYRWQLEKQSQDTALARSRFLPSLDVSYSAHALDASNRLENKDNSVLYGAVRWNVFAGLSDMYRLRSAQHLEQVEELQLAAISQDIKLQVALRYLDIYRGQANLQVAEESQRTLAKLATDAREQYEVGLIEKNEMLRFRVDLDSATILLKRAQAELAKGVQNLAFEVDQPITAAELRFSEFLHDPALAPAESYQQKLTQQRSELLVLEELALATDMEIKASYGDYGPRLDLTSSYRRYEDDQLPGNGSHSDEELRATAMLSINLFDGLAKRARLGKNKSEKRSLKAQHHELGKELKRQLATFFLDYEVSQANAEVAKLSIEQAEENLRITRLKYSEGLERESELLDAITNLARARYTYVAARANLFATYFQIQRAVEEL